MKINELAIGQVITAKYNMYMGYKSICVKKGDTFTVDNVKGDQAIIIHQSGKVLMVSKRIESVFE